MHFPKNAQILTNMIFFPLQIGFADLLLLLTNVHFRKDIH